MATIKVYGRIRPVRKRKRPADYLIVDDSKRLELRPSKKKPELRHAFDFNGKLFDQDVDQGELYDTVAQPIVQSVLDGFNGTIFAYGQSGSGKTYTMTGSSASYEKRGVIPRAIAQIFEHMEECSDRTFNVRISYLEIYQNRGYDLLDPKHAPQKVEDLPRVVLRDDGSGSVHVSNLNSFPVDGQEAALNHLFVGDTNRMICETANNELSSRSHCIFTVFLQSQEAGSSKVRRSKLNLVDLAGSERIDTAKGEQNEFSNVSNVGINLSLHHLANVIIALHERRIAEKKLRRQVKATGMSDRDIEHMLREKEAHVPYRNSMLTAILRDSLEGRCTTCMIATLSAEARQVKETISSCRFASRVAVIPINPVVNEAMDPSVRILHLQSKLEKMQKADEDRKRRRKKPLDAKEKEGVCEMLRVFLAQNGPWGIDVPPVRRAWFSMLLMRRMLLEGAQCSNCHARSPLVVTAGVIQKASADSSRCQREADTGKNCGGVKEEDAQEDELETVLLPRRGGLEQVQEQSAVEREAEPTKTRDGRAGDEGVPRDANRVAGGAVRSSISEVPRSKQQAKVRSTEATGRLAGEDAVEVQSESEKEECEEAPRGQGSCEEYEKEAIRLHALIKEKVGHAREAAKTLDAFKTKMNNLRSAVSSMLEKAKSRGDDVNGDELKELKDAMTRTRSKYKHCFEGLKAIKLEVMHLKLLLKQAKLRVARARKRDANGALPTVDESTPPRRARAAWGDHASQKVLQSPSGETDTHVKSLEAIVEEYKAGPGLTRRSELESEKIKLKARMESCRALGLDINKTRDHIIHLVSRHKAMSRERKDAELKDSVAKELIGSCSGPESARRVRESQEKRNREIMCLESSIRAEKTSYRKMAKNLEQLKAEIVEETARFREMKQRATEDFNQFVDKSRRRCAM